MRIPQNMLAFSLATMAGFWTFAAQAQSPVGSTAGAPPVGVAEIRIDSELSDEMVHFLATQSVRSAVPRTRGRIDDLVRETCGYSSPNNLRVFTAALADQGAALEEGRFSLDAAATQVPVCLPDEKQTRIVGRLPGKGDSFYQYFKTDLGVRLTASDAGAAMPVNPDVKLEPVIEYAGHRTKSRWRVPAEPTAGSEAIARAKDYLFASGVDPLDGSRVAFESFVATNELIAAGVAPAATRVALDQSLTSLGVPDTDDIWARVDTALETGQQEPLIRDLPIMADYCGTAVGQARTAEGLCDAPAAGAAVELPSRTSDVITSLNGPDRAADASTIFVSVPVVSVEQVNKSAAVLVTSTDNAPEGASTRAVTDAEVASATDDTSLSLFLNVENANDRSCRGNSYRNWNTPEFLERFRTALAQTVAAKKAADSRLNSTLVLVLDGGFFRFDTESFGAVDWDSVLPGQADASAESLDGMVDSLVDKVVHGTVVTGLALGGPGLMDSFGAFGMPISIATNTAYKAQGPAGSERYVVHDNLPARVDGENANIINLSIGANNETTGSLHILKQSFLNRPGPLFVVAAGNNGNNDAPSGRSVTETGLVPQTWGVGEAEGLGVGSYNVLVVAALDGDGQATNLAWFSNFDRQHVYLAAPGCNVAAWSPMTSGENREYQVATYNGTSFAAPIVSFVGAAVHALMPRGRIGAPWVRARLLATADIDADLDRAGVRYGRILSPVAAVRIYEDVLTLNVPLVADGPLELAGRLLDASADNTFSKSMLCDTNYNPKHELLRLFKLSAPDAPPIWHVDIMTQNALMITRDCTLKQGATVRILVDGVDTVVPIEKIADIKFAVRRGE